MNTLFVLFAIYLTSSNVALDLEGTPHNYVDVNDCIGAMKEAAVKLEQKGVYVEGRVHVTCTLMQVSEIPHRSATIKLALMRKAQVDSLPNLENK